MSRGTKESLLRKPIPGKCIVDLGYTGQGLWHRAGVTFRIFRALTLATTLTGRRAEMNELNLNYLLHSIV